MRLALIVIAVILASSALGQSTNTNIVAHVLATAITPTSIRLEMSADNPTGVLLLGYRVYRNGLLIATVTNRNAALINVKLTAQ